MPDFALAGVRVIPRVAVVALGIVLAVGAVTFAVAWGHPYCVTNPVMCPTPVPGYPPCHGGLVTSCSNAHVALRAGIAVVGVGAGLAIAILVEKSRPRKLRV